ncbi:MAG: NifB/NifX family molybdenum-iron cluster-binding protein [Candidatus Omnitrophota bacterium]
MKLGITIEDDKGLESNVSMHFGQCPYFLIVDIEGDKVTKSEVASNTAVHGGGGCVAVDELLKHNIDCVISGGMGMGAQQKFAAAGVKVFGYSGSVESAIEALLSESLGNLGSCKDHGDCH